MQFLLIAFDGTNPGAEELRARVRPVHLEKISRLKRNGEFLFGGAILNEEGKMKGSMILYDVKDRDTLEERLKEEPYVYENVWQKIEIYPFRLAIIE
ncbi:MAG: YciI family protein [Bacteroidales bacterium]